MHVLLHASSACSPPTALWVQCELGHIIHVLQVILGEGGEAIFKPTVAPGHTMSIQLVTPMRFVFAERILLT